MDNDTPQSVISAGQAVYEVLSEALAHSVTKVFPVVTDEAVLPYVCYHREALEATPTKARHSADTAVVQVDIYAATYGQSVTLAEAVRQALDWRTITTSTGLVVRSCYLIDAKEDWQDDAYIQTLTFRLSC